MLCAGFSYGAADGSGFYKKDFQGEWSPSAAYDGYDILSRARPSNATATDVYARLLSDASVAVLLLNRNDTAAQRVCVRWGDVGLNGFARAAVRDLWQHADVGPAVGGYCASVEPHDVVMLRVQQ